MDLALNRKLAGRSLPEGSRIIAAVNEGDQYQLHELSVVNDGLYRFLEVENVPEKDKEMVVKNIEAYFDYLAKNKKEAAAHFANLYVSKTYPNAVCFFAKECRILTDGYAPEPTIPDGMKCKIIWVCEDRSSYEKNHKWMQRSGRVCTIELD